MEEPKPFASLGPTLLARKGGAKPAMRPQVSPLSPLDGDSLDDANADLDDLGWNDMGDDEPPVRREAQVLQLTPYGAEDAVDEDEDEEVYGEAEAYDDYDDEPEDRPAEPEVLRQRRAIDASLASAPVHEPAPVRTRAPAPGPSEGRRAAFTLRLDRERHLKLRLASTLCGRSAQMLVTEALDRFLSEMPELEALAAQVKRN